MTEGFEPQVVYDPSYVSVNLHHPLIPVALLVPRLGPGLDLRVYIVTGSSKVRHVKSLG